VRDETDPARGLREAAGLPGVQRRLRYGALTIAWLATPEERVDLDEG
jgi:hypothetical protein